MYVNQHIEYVILCNVLYTEYVESKAGMGMVYVCFIACHSCCPYSPHCNNHFPQNATLPIFQDDTRPRLICRTVCHSIRAHTFHINDNKYNRQKRIHCSREGFLCVCFAGVFSIHLIFSRFLAMSAFHRNREIFCVYKNHAKVKYAIFTMSIWMNFSFGIFIFYFVYVEIIVAGLFSLPRINSCTSSGQGAHRACIQFPSTFFNRIIVIHRSVAYWK